MGLSKGVKSRAGRSRKTLYLKTNNIDRHANIDPKKLRDMLAGRYSFSSASASTFTPIASGLSSQDRTTLLGEQMDGFNAPEISRNDAYEFSVPAGEEGELLSNAGGDYALSQDILTEINEYVFSPYFHAKLTSLPGFVTTPALGMIVPTSKTKHGRPSLPTSPTHTFDSRQGAPVSLEGPRRWSRYRFFLLHCTVSRALLPAAWC